MRLKKYTPDTVGKQKRGEAFVKLNVVELNGEKFWKIFTDKALKTGI